MVKGKTITALLAGILIGLAFIASACRPDQTLAGQWRTEGPASLLFEYRDDGTVVLVKEQEKFPVFHYKIVDDNTLQLYDGMGRVRAYDFEVSGETLIFYEDRDAGVIAEKYRREP